MCEILENKKNNQLSINFTSIYLFVISLDISFVVLIQDPLVPKLFGFCEIYSD